MNRKLFIAAAAVVLASALGANAQQLPSGRWWQRPDIVRELELTRGQQTRLDEVFRGAANDLIDSKAAVEKLQVALRGELDRPQLRRNELLRIAGELSAARGRLFERELIMLADMRGVLNDEQWARVRTVLDREPGARRGEGQRPGGAKRPGGGPAGRRGGDPGGRRP